MKRLVLMASLALPAAGHAANWQMDAKQSRLSFTATQQGADFDGQFSGFTADIQFDPADLAHSRVSVTIPLGGVETRDKSRDDSLKGGEWFDIAHFPAARFQTTAFSGGGGHYVAAAMLTLHGVGRAVNFPFTLVIQGDRAELHGTVRLRRLDFGIGWKDTGQVGDEVTVRVDLAAKKIQ